MLTEPYSVWASLLSSTEATKGDAEALRILRLKQDQHRRAMAGFASAIDEKTARDAVFPALRPAARKNGQMVYTLRDGGRLIDAASSIWLEIVSPHAQFLMLSLQMERSPNRAIPLAGPPAFQRQAVEIAARTKLDLTFADPELERLRRQLRGLPEPQGPIQPPASGLAHAARALIGRLGGVMTAGFRRGRA